MIQAATDTLSAEERSALLEDEQLIIRNSGEIPEVAMHSSLYYLSCDPEGPGLKLSTDEVQGLALMVVERYRVIILRDLTPENRRERIYRGLARSAVNWQRLAKFCASRSLSLEKIRQEIAPSLIRFLEQELDEVTKQCLSSSCINCSKKILITMAKSLGLDPEALPQGWEGLCPEE